MSEQESLRLEKLSLLIGKMVGQISELLNYMKRPDSTLSMSYQALLDMHHAAALQIHELYYKDNK